MPSKRFIQSQFDGGSTARRGTIILSTILALAGLLYLLAGLDGIRAASSGVQGEEEQVYLDASSDNKLIVGIDVPYEPFSYYSGTELVGYDIDLVDALAGEMNTSIEFKIVPWSMIFDELVAGNLDAIVSAVSITPEREVFMDFTLPYLEFSNEPVPIGIGVQQGDVETRRTLNETLWKLREDGTLETNRAGVDAYYADIFVTLPDWPLVYLDKETSLTYTETMDIKTVIQIPVGALTGTVMIVHTPTMTDTIPLGFFLAGQPFDLDAFRAGIFVDEFTFQMPVTLTHSYSPASVTGIDEDAIVLDRWDDNLGSWEEAACGPYDRHPDDNWLAVPICELGRFAFVEEQYFSRLPITVSE